MDNRGQTRTVLALVLRRSRFRAGSVPREVRPSQVYISNTQTSRLLPKPLAILRPPVLSPLLFLGLYKVLPP